MKPLHVLPRRLVSPAPGLRSAPTLWTTVWTALAAVLLAALLAAAPGPARAGEAAPASTPSELRAAALRAAGLVNLADVAPGVLIDIRYATAQNTFGRVLYPSAACWLRVEAAEAVARAQAALKPKGLGLKVWDCYRPFSVQESLWADVPNPDFVAEPRRDAAGTPVLGSKHNRGKAVDITLVDAAGHELRMPSGFDDFSSKAARECAACDAGQLEHFKLLESTMKAQGFEGIPSEWWHYDHHGWEACGLLDLDLP